MKKKGSKIEFSEDRTRELCQAIRAMMATDGHIDLNALARRAVRLPCSRFWVSEERARDVIYRMQRGDELDANMRPERRRMFEEINRRVSEQRLLRPDTPVTRLVVEIVNSPAPEYYIIPSSATTHYRKHQKSRLNRLRSATPS